MQQYTFYDEVDNRVWTRVMRGPAAALLSALAHIKRRPFHPHRTVCVFVGNHMARRTRLGLAYVEITDHDKAHTPECRRAVVNWEHISR